MGNSGGAILAILLIGGIAMLLLFGGSLMAFASDLPGAIGDFINQLRNAFNGGAGGDLTGQTWIGYTVYFTDGTNQEIRQESPSYSIMPLSISFAGKEILTLKADIKAKLICGEAIGAWSSDCSITFEAYLKPEATPKTSSTATYHNQGASWANGETKTLQSITIQASQLEAVVSTYGDGAWLLQYLGTVDLTVNVGGVDIDLNAANPAGGIDLTYVGGSATGGTVNNSAPSGLDAPN